MKTAIYFLIIVTSVLVSSYAYTQPKDGGEQYRPKIHFTPPRHWMNDPNGMVYYKGTYHLFYQHFPEASIWGPMHWGYATSKDLFRWKHQPIAIFPDSIGMIFSGSAVVDSNNTSGFGKDGKIPLVAIYTQHNDKMEKAGRSDYQNQSLAYSLDEGKTWIKYSRNPVLKTPNIRDFRDPKVMWHEASKKWIMTLAVVDHIEFFSSPDLKTWTRESEFGKTAGAHGGVWECPDLFTLDYNNKKHWVLIVNLNPGGPNSGSATQYFLGDFDGKQFTPYSTETKWLDYGPDEYAGVTWSNTGNRRIFLGWMSNWNYGQVVPTEKWRSAMTIPRELKLTEAEGKMRVASLPVSEISTLQKAGLTRNNLPPEELFDLASKFNATKIPCIIKLSLDSVKDFSFVLSNDAGEKLVIGYDMANNQYYIDRTKSGIVGFHKDFASVDKAPRFLKTSNLDLTLVIDVSSVELFADKGLSVLTSIFFPGTPYNKITFTAPGGLAIKELAFTELKSAW